MAMAYTQMTRFAKSGFGCVRLAAPCAPSVHRVTSVTGQIGAIRQTPLTVAHCSRRAFALAAAPCDSPRNRHANAMFTRQTAAAISPGAWRPHVDAAEPISGPIITPTLVAADNHPSPFARFLGSTTSDTYAWMTPTVPPPAPWIMRETNSSQSESANANTT